MEKNKMYGVNTMTDRNHEFNFSDVNEGQEHVRIIEESEEDYQERKQSELTPKEQFEIWKELPGCKLVLRQVYRYASYYAKGWQRTGQKVSVRLIWGLVRHHIKSVRIRAKARGIDLQKWQGYTLNNTLTPYVARHIIEHRKEWAGLFELRKVGGEK